MRKLKPLIMAMLLLAACKPGEQKQEESADSAATEPTANATSLTDEQKAEGWMLLFDGKSMDGWKFFKDKENNSWEIVDGTLHCKPYEEGVTDKRADIMTVSTFDNFELAFDFKVAPKGNSGVMYRVVEDYDEPYLSGPEFQVIDDVGYPGEGDPLKDTQLTGANYDMHAAATKAAKPIGEWNSARLVVNGTHVEHWLNGEKVVEYEINSPDWTERKKGSKWNEAAGYAASPAGHIDFQDHGTEVTYRNIMIKKL